MYGYEWTDEYGIFKLSVDVKLQKEIRPVFSEELDFFGLNEYWDYPHNTKEPLLWAEGVRRYILNGRCVAEAQGGGFYSRPQIKLKTDDRLILQPVDINRLYEVNKPFIMGLEQKAIRFIREQYQKYKKLGYEFICAFSGGKDSLLLLDLISKSLAPGDYYIIFSNTGMELKTTIEAIEAAKKHWQGLRFEEAKCHMEASDSWREFGPPASRLRWCCSVHKSVPTLLLMQQIAGRSCKAVVFDGVRAEESIRRSRYEEVGEGVKNSQQINCHAVLKWSSAEVFIYLLKNNLLLNEAYRVGIYRVGCKVCPMSAKWQDSLIAFHYPDEISNPLHFLEELTEYAKGKLDRSYIEDGGWQARTGGKILKQGENRVGEYIDTDNDTLVFTLSNTKQRLEDVIPLFGNVVDKIENGLIIQGKKEKIIVQILQDQTDNAKIKFSVKPFSRLDRYDISALRGIANKTAYCIGCKACMPQCPTGAFQIIDGKILIRSASCIHCYNCCAYTSKGCMVAKSLFVRRDNMVNPDKYRNFGFRQTFYEHFVDNGVSCFDMNSLGKDQYKALKQWLGEAGMLKKQVKGKKETIVLELSSLGERLIKYGAYNPVPWAIMWANLAYNSIIVNTFCMNVDAGAEFNNDYLIDCLDSDIDEKYRKQAVNSLLSTFRDSPIGSAIKQGLSIEKTTYLRTGWDYPDPVVLLYTLYLYGEHTGRKKFGYSELVNAHNNPTARGISPADIFGIDQVQLREFIQGIAVSYPDYIRVSFISDLDNISLENYKSEDILLLLDD